MGPTVRIPLGAPPAWHAVVAVRAGLRCECTGQCGMAHSKSGGRCPRRHEGWHNKRTTVVTAAPKDLTLPPSKAAGLPDAELKARCDDCLRREQKLAAVSAGGRPADGGGLFDADGSIPEELTAATAAPEPDLIREVPFQERGDLQGDTVYTIAESMRVTIDGGVGRAQFRPGARLAYRSLLAQGWTPPGPQGDETARLRAELLRMQGRLDEMQGQLVHQHGAEAAADSRRGSLAFVLRATAVSMRELSEAAAVKRQPEPTFTATQVAASLERALARDRR